MIPMLRLFYGVWLAGIWLIVLHALAMSAFGGGKWKRRGRSFLFAALFSVVWPLAAFSRKGRRILVLKTDLRD